MRTIPDDPTTGEAHGVPAHVHDWVAMAGTDPDALLAAVEAATGLRLAARSPGQGVHGYLTTLAAPHGLYARLVLYTAACDGTACGHGHAGTPHLASPALAPAKRVALVAASGEQAGRRLGQGDDLTVLAALDPRLGFAEAERDRIRRSAEVSADGG